MPWYIGDKASSIDEHVKCLSLPNCISRLPRSIVGDLNNWEGIRVSHISSSVLLSSNFMEISARQIFSTLPTFCSCHLLATSRVNICF